MGSIVIWDMEAGVLRYVSNLPYGIYTRCGAFPGYPNPPEPLAKTRKTASTPSAGAGEEVALPS